MNLLDMQTVFFSSVISTAICAIIVVSLWWQNRRRFPGLGLWVADFVMQWLAIVAIGLRPILPVNASILLGIPLFLGGTLLLYIGLEQYLGKTSAQRYNWLLLASFLIVHAYFAVAHPSLQARNINFSVALIVLCLQCAWLLLRRVDAAMRAATGMVGVVFCVYVLVSAVRIGVDLIVPPGNDLFQSGLYDTLALMAYQMLFIALTLALVLMVNRRLMAELEQDIRERRQAEAELQSSKEKFSLAFTTSPYAITITRLADGKLLEVNDAFTTITGFTRGEAMTSSSIELSLWVNPEDRQAVVAELHRGQNVVNREFRFNTKTGTVITGLFSCSCLVLGDEFCALSSINDITDYKRAEEVVAYEQIFRNALIDSIPGAFYMLDERGGYVKWNAYQRDEIIGKPEEEIAGFCALETIHPDDREQIQARIVNVIKNGGVETVEGRVLLRGGPDFRWLLMTGRQMMINGHPFLVGIGIDITSPKEADMERQAAQRETERLLAEAQVSRRALLGVVEDQQEAAMTLREFGAYLDRIINAIGDPVFVKDECSRFVLVNDALCALLGKARDALLGTTGLEFLPPEQMNHFLEVDREMLSSGEENLCEEALTVGDGSIRAITTRKTRYVNDHGAKFIVGVIRDSTEHKSMEDQLRQQQRTGI